MKLKLQCQLVLKTDAKPIEVAEDINIIDVPDGMNDEQIQKFFAQVKNNMKIKYQSVINDMFDVVFKEV